MVGLGISSNKRYLALISLTFRRKNKDWPPYIDRGRREVMRFLQQCWKCLGFDMKMLKEKVNHTYYISQMMLKDGDFYPMEDLNPLKKKSQQQMQAWEMCFQEIQGADTNSPAARPATTYMNFVLKTTGMKWRKWKFRQTKSWGSNYIVTTTHLEALPRYVSYLLR